LQAQQAMPITNQKELDEASNKLERDVSMHHDQDAERWLSQEAKGSWVNKPDYKRASQHRASVESGKVASVFTLSSKFKRRYFVFKESQNKVEYYNSDAPADLSKSPNGILDLEGMEKVVIAAVHDANDNSLDLVNSKQHFTMEFDNEREMCKCIGTFVLINYHQSKQIIHSIN
jgi:hypothetical protein